MPLKLLHVADVHLDAPFGWLGGKGREQRRQLADTFRASVDLAIKEDVDAVLIAGDLFDSNSPSQSAVELVRGELRRLDRPTFILPGTHDCLDGGSIYRRVDFHADAPRVRVFDAERSTFEVEGLGLAIHASANLTRTSPVSPIARLAPSAEARFNVALAHGSLAMPGTEQDFPLTAQEIAGSGFDYLALGHWHSCRDCSAGRTAAWYSGPPELLKPDEVGAALLVELPTDGGRARVTPHPLGARRFERATFQIDGLADRAALRSQLIARRNPSLVLQATLAGVCPLDLMLDAEGLAEELADDFFALRIEDRTHPALDGAALADLPENLVIGQFARRMRQKIEEATDEASRRQAEAALQVGLALLQGKRVL